MFWDRFYSLCLENNTRPNPVAKALGFSSAACTKWKNGTNPSLDVVEKIAKYFNVTSDYLIGITDDKQQVVPTVDLDKIDEMTELPVPSKISVKFRGSLDAIQKVEDFLRESSGEYYMEEIKKVPEDEKMDSSFFWETFKKLCKKVNKSPNAVCKELGFSAATATHWKNNKKPSWASLKKIAEYFDVSVDYLLGEQNQQKTAADAPPLSPEQQKILVYCSDLSDEDLGKVLEYIELLHMRRKNSENSDA